MTEAGLRVIVWAIEMAAIRQPPRAANQGEAAAVMPYHLHAPDRADSIYIHRPAESGGSVQQRVSLTHPAYREPAWPAVSRAGEGYALSRCAPSVPEDVATIIENIGLTLKIGTQ